MKQGTIKYSQEFISPTGLKRWVTIEHPLDFDSEDYLQVYEKVASMVAVCGSKPPADLTGMPGQNAPISDSLPTINRAHERLLVLIDNAKTSNDLSDYYNNALNAGLLDAYNNKMQQLMRNENNGAKK